MTNPHELRCPRNAFTLVEVMVALALGALLLAAAQRLLGFAHRTAVTVQADERARSFAAAPFDVFRDDLRMRPAGGGFSLRGGILEFVTLNALMSPTSAARHSVQVEYEAVTGRGELALERRERELEAPDEPWVALEVVRGLTAVEFAVSDGRSWQPEWPPSIPRAATAIRLRLTHADGRIDERDFPLGALRWRRHDE